MIIDDDLKEEVSFPITIQRRKMPVLTYREGETFSDMVTIVTKTFMRYDCLINLLDSLNQFYPNVRVIIADDTPDDLYHTVNITQVWFFLVKSHETFSFPDWVNIVWSESNFLIKYPNVKQYKMPS